MRGLLVSLLLVGVAIPAASANGALSRVSDAQRVDRMLRSIAARSQCAPATPDARVTQIGDRLTMMPGMGNSTLPGASTNANAQEWFDYGLSLARAFQQQDAIAAFQEGERLDPRCAMCIWGQAWAMGPTINGGIAETRRRSAAALLHRAANMAMDGPEKNRDLIAATLTRYEVGDARAGDIAFAEAMNSVAAKYSADVEIGVLAADAWLIAGFSRGDSRGYGRALALLEQALKIKPDDAGALHFYIHATEMAKQPAKALEAARRLPIVAPAASHLVHMPSHTYFGVGQYSAAVKSNRDAVATAHTFAAKTGFQSPMGNFPYFVHSLNYGISAALLTGDGPYALEAALTIPKSYPDFSLLTPWVQFEVAKYYFAHARFASRDQVLNLKEPKPAYLRVMWRYARGESAARAADAGAVRAELAQMQMAASDLADYGDVAFIAKAATEVARLTLEGRAAMIEKNWPAAIEAFSKAAVIDDETLAQFRDPPIWWISPRRSLAAAYLKSGKPGAAKQNAEQVLTAWPNDPGTLFVLWMAQTAVGEAANAKASLEGVRRGWVGDPGLLKLDGL